MIEDKATPEYERWVRAKAGHRHVHVWIEYTPWRSWGWDPHRGRTDLYVCDVPGCLKMRAEPEKGSVMDEIERQIAIKTTRRDIARLHHDLQLVDDELGAVLARQRRIQSDLSRAKLELEELLGEGKDSAPHTRDQST